MFSSACKLKVSNINFLLTLWLRLELEKERDEFRYVGHLRIVSGH